MGMKTAGNREVMQRKCYNGSAAAKMVSVIGGSGQAFAHRRGSKGRTFEKARKVRRSISQETCHASLIFAVPGEGMRREEI